MRILQVIHDFLPNHQAGSELYCFHLSKALQARGHTVQLFYSEIDHERPNYSVRDGEYEGLPFREIVNNHAYQDFEDTYLNPAIERAFAALLDCYQPDIVHFHHLLSLSYGIVGQCQERGIRTVFTLHDYWLTCPRGGQRFRGEGQVCVNIDESLCASCVGRYAIPSRSVRLLKRFLTPRQIGSPATLLDKMAMAKIETPEQHFVGRGECTIEGDRRDALFAHPPTRIRQQLRLPKQAMLRFAFAMDPSTYDKEGGAVCFEVLINGERLFSQTLDAKRDPEDRGWHTGTIPIDSETARIARIEWVTKAVPEEDWQFCAACWADVAIMGLDQTPENSTLLERIQKWGEHWVGRQQNQRMRPKITARRQATQSLFDQVDLFIAPSPFLRKKFIEYGMPAEKIIYSDYGIADLGYTEAPRDPKPPIRFTYVGTLIEHKGLHVLIEAFNNLPHDQATLNVYGSIHEFAAYTQRIQQMIQHPHIYLRGRAENDEIPQILAHSDALIVPSIWFENSPITIHEAFLARVPVITSNFGGMADLVRDGENGFLFEMGNPESLRKCLASIVANPQRLVDARPDPQEVKGTGEDAAWIEQQYEALLNHRLVESS